MDWFSGLPVWTVAGLIFCFRIMDVSLGTMRTITVVVGRVKLSVLLGFFEVLIWITAISQLFLGIREHPILIAAWAGGFATGNAIGITLEKQLAMGRCVVRIITAHGDAVVRAIDPPGKALAKFLSTMPEGERTLVFAVLNRRDLNEVLELARREDPELFWVVERFSETSHLDPLPHATGWRAVFKMK